MSEPDKSAPRRAGQYLRVSVDKSGRARSNDEQQRDNERDAAAENWRMVKTYRDPDRSASRYATKAREDYDLLLRDIARREIDLLYLWEPSRGSRRVSEWVTLIELAEAKHVLIRVTSHGRTYDPANPRDRRSLLEDAVDSEYESGKVSVRVKRAAAASAAEGRPWGKVPYGYEREYDPHTGALVSQTPDPVTAPVLKEIVARILRGDPVRTIADDLTERGIPTPAQYRNVRRGLPTESLRGWSRGTLRTLLQSPTSVGLRVHQGAVVGEAGWEPLVSASDYQTVQQLLRSRVLRMNPGSAVKHLLSGIAECGVCGARCVRQINNGIPSYVCGGLPARPGEPRPSRKHVTRAQDGLDAMVTLHVVDRLADPALLEGISRAAAGADERAAVAVRELGELQARLAQFEESAKTKGGMLAASFERVAAGLVEQIAEVQGRMAQASGLPPAVLDLAGPDAVQRWAGIQSDKSRQRQVVRALVRVVVHRSNLRRGVRGFDRSSIEIIDL